MEGELIPREKVNALAGRDREPEAATRYGEAIALATASALCALCVLVLTAPLLSLIFATAQLGFFIALAAHARRHGAAIEQHTTYLALLSK